MTGVGESLGMREERVGFKVPINKIRDGKDMGREV